MSKESSPKIKEIVSLMHTLLVAYGTSQIEHSWETPSVNGKIITCYKDHQNLLVYSLRKNNLSPICTISDEIIDRKGRKITSHRTLNKIQNQINLIADHLDSAHHH